MAETAKPAAKPKKEKDDTAGVFWLLLIGATAVLFWLHGSGNTNIYPHIRPGTPNTIYGWDYPDDLGVHRSYITAEWSPKVKLGIAEGKRLTFDTPALDTRVTVLINEDDADGGQVKDAPTRREVEEG